MKNKTHVPLPFFKSKNKVTKNLTNEKKLTKSECFIKKSHTPFSFFNVF